MYASIVSCTCSIEPWLTFEIAGLDHADARPAVQRAGLASQLCRHCPKVGGKAGDGQAGLVQHVMRPGEADVGLECILGRGAFLVHHGEQGRNDVGEAGRGGRGRGRGSLAAVRGYLRLGARCEGEALNWR